MSNLGIAVLTLLFWATAWLPALTTQQATITLYSLNKYQGKRGKEVEQLTFCLNFQTRAMRSCDLRYGSLYVGEDHDWFESSGAQGNRSVIKDLGPKIWEEPFTIPVVEPLPKLKPGEQRVITIDASGADGADGAPGAPGRPGADADGVVRERPSTHPAAVTRVPSRPKHDGKPKVDPMYVKAILGHMYVIHVVDDTRDFYALFRVDAIERGDNCRISWRLVYAPQASAGNEQR